MTFKCSKGVVELMLMAQKTADLQLLGFSHLKQMVPICGIWPKILLLWRKREIGKSGTLIPAYNTLVTNKDTIISSIN